MPLSLSIVTTPVTCGQTDDGTAIATFSGGVPPYDLYWHDPAERMDSPAVSPVTLTGYLTPDTYYATLVDSEMTEIQVPYTIYPPVCIDVSVTYNCDDKLVGVVTGDGVLPYTYQWYHLGFAIAGANNITLSKSDFILGLSYKLIVTDAHGSTGEFTMTPGACPIPTPETEAYSNCCDNQTNIVWLNRQGGFENYIFSGVKTFEVDGGSSKTFITNFLKKYSEKTGIYNGKVVTTSSVPRSHVDKLDSLRQCIQAWEWDEDDNTFTEILVDTTDYEKYGSKQKIFDVAIRFIYAEEILIQRQ